MLVVLYTSVGKRVVTPDSVTWRSTWRSHSPRGEEVHGRGLMPCAAPAQGGSPLLRRKSPPNVLILSQMRIRASLEGPYLYRVNPIYRGKFFDARDSALLGETTSAVRHF